MGGQPWLGEEPESKSRTIMLNPVNTLCGSMLNKKDLISLIQTNLNNPCFCVTICLKMTELG